MKSKGRRLLALAFVAMVVAGCTPIWISPAPALPTATTQLEDLGGLSAEEARTLASLEMVDAYPLYVMHFYAPYDLGASIQLQEELASRNGISSCHTPWACSLFAALSDESNMLYGRNFDWDYSPAVLLFTQPADGYASVSMVDIVYLGFGGANAGSLMDRSLSERRALLQAPLLPFDGMNEQGLTVGMAAVPPGDMVPDPEKATTGSLRIIRMILDQAANVDEAVAILQSHNIDIAGGPPLHYLIADRTGSSVLVEFYQGEMIVIANQEPWHQATNFLRTEAGGLDAGICWRYDTIYQRLVDTAGEISAEQAMDLLQDVSQQGTQWSVVYGISTGEIMVSMGRQYETVHAFDFPAP
jgi:hypothetical protein